MKVLILYRPDSDHARIVEQYVTDFHRFHGEGGVDMVSIDTREGAEKAEIYGITQYPAVLAVKDDGQMERMWQGEALPLMNDLAYYTHQ